MWERRITPWLTVRGWRGPETNGRRSGGYEIRFGSEREHDAAPPSLWRRLLYDAALALIWGLIVWQVWQRGQLGDLPNDLMLGLSLAVTVYLRVHAWRPAMELRAPSE